MLYIFYRPKEGDLMLYIFYRPKERLGKEMFFNGLKNPISLYQRRSK